MKGFWGWLYKKLWGGRLSSYIIVIGILLALALLNWGSGIYKYIGAYLVILTFLLSILVSIISVILGGKNSS